MKVGFFSILGLMLICLKLAELGAVSSWSWWLVLLPLYGPVVAVAIFAMLVSLFVYIAGKI